MSCIIYTIVQADAVPRYWAYYGRGSGPILLDDVQCGGNHQGSLIDCDHRPIGVHNCVHYEDAGVTCQPGRNEDEIESMLFYSTTQMSVKKMISDCKVEVRFSMEEWRYARVIHGRQSVITTGPLTMQQWLAGSWGSQIQVQSETMY